MLVVNSASGGVEGRRSERPQHHVGRESMTERERNFPDLLARLMDECVGIIAQYEQKRSALFPLMHLFQKHEGYVSREAVDAVARAS